MAASLLRFVNRNIIHKSSRSVRNFSSNLSLLNSGWKNSLQLHQNNVAIIQDDHQLTYDELDSRIGSLCHMFREQYNLQKNDKLFHVSGSRIDDLPILMACARLGIIYMPMNPFSKLQMMNAIKSTKPQLIINEPAFSSFIPEDTAIDRIVLTEEFDPKNWLANQYQNTLHSSEDGNGSACDVCNEDIFQIIFTSGTTGDPKGVVCSHNSVYGSLRVSTYDDPTMPGDYTLITSSLLGALGALQRLAVLLEGSTMIYPNKHKFRDVLHWHDLCENKHPQISRLLIFGKAISDIYTLNKSFNNLKYVSYGGDFTPLKIILRLKSNILQPSAKLIHRYGSSETYACTALDPNILDDLVSDVLNNKDGANTDMIVPVGTPINSNVFLKINHDGEVMVKKTDGGTMVEYFNLPEMTRSVMTPDGWILTGDLGYFDDKGLLYLRGRKKDVIKNNLADCVYPVEIESIISAHSDVDEVAVVGFPNALNDETTIGETPVAFVVLDKHAQLNRDLNEVKEELFELCNRLLDEKHMVKKIFFVSALPQTTARKTNKKALRQMIVDGKYKM